METEKNDAPSFLDLMELWRIEFNETNKHQYEMYFHDFSTSYYCMKVKRTPNEEITNHVCIGHLHTGRDEDGNGVEFSGEWLRPEDPEFFPRLMERVFSKINA